MPQWAGSCWYYLRFCDPRNGEAAWSPEAERYWMPVDLYVGGAEHAVLHLLYARFWHKVLYDLGLVSTKEPFQKLLNPGMVQAKSYRYFEDGSGSQTRFHSYEQVRYEGETPVHRETGQELRECWVPSEEVCWKEGKPLAPDRELPLEEITEKMSKSRGNVVNPDEVIKEYGADAMRLYEMFIGPLRKAAPWSTDGIPGVFRFLQRAYRLIIEEIDAEDRVRKLSEGEGTPAQQKLLARTIDRVTSDIEALDLNTAISSLMVLVRDIEKDGPLPHGAAQTITQLLAPFAPHLAEELWEQLGHTESVAYTLWPEADPALLVDEEVEIAVQVQGKLRARIQVPAEADEALVREVALREANVRRHVGDREPRRVVYVPGRLLNLVL